MGTQIVIYEFEGIGHITDEDLAVDIAYHYTVEAQRTTGIAPRPDDVAIRRITVHHDEAPEGIEPPAWIALTSRVEYALNALLTARAAVQEALEAAARDAWDRGLITVTKDSL